MLSLHINFGGEIISQFCSLDWTYLCLILTYFILVYWNILQRKWFGLCRFFLEVISVFFSIIHKDLIQFWEKQTLGRLSVLTTEVIILARYSTWSLQAYAKTRLESILNKTISVKYMKAEMSKYITDKTFWLNSSFSEFNCNDIWHFLAERYIL